MRRMRKRRRRRRRRRESPSGLLVQSACCVVETKGLIVWHEAMHGLREMKKFLSTALWSLRPGSGYLTWTPKGLPQV